ncbi:uncharacterized protein [Dermacentor andersoni]|uniref:uncharacterized protein n=1 Tax=Dermacentor andersoni TaxID=34620 RepID=UPI002155DF9B|nr:uncharacterized protein LOC126529359 [Dermacentor andersoni]
MARQVLTFSPPTKQVESEAAAVEVLLLQPFAKPPQVTFENVAARREAVRQLLILNTTNTEQLVTLSVPRDKGFSADADIFKLAPGQQQRVTFVWKPDGNEPATRVGVSVSTDKGYRGRLILLGTLRQETLPRKKQVPRSSILTSSQKPNLTFGPARKVPTQPTKKAAPDLAQCTKKAVAPARITIPVEFKTGSKKRTACENTYNASVKSTPLQKQTLSSLSESNGCSRSDNQYERCCPVEQTALSVPADSGCLGTDIAQTGVSPAAHPYCKSEDVMTQTETICPEVRRETFSGGINSPKTTSSVSEDSHDHVSADHAHSLPDTGAISASHYSGECGNLKPQVETVYTEVESGHNLPLETSVNAAFKENLESMSTTFEDSLNVATRDSASLEAVNANEANSSQNNTFELDLSARMDMLYQQIANRPSDGAQENASDSHEQLNVSAYLSSLYNEMCEEKSKELLCSLPVLSNTLTEETLSERRSSSPKRPCEVDRQDNSLENLLRELELGASGDSLVGTMQQCSGNALFDGHVNIEDYFPADVSSIRAKPEDSL